MCRAHAVLRGACASVLLAAQVGAAATFDVNTTTDAVDANPGDGRCETAPGNGICTLRAAIQETNALPGADAITLPPGTIKLTVAGYDEDGAASGDLDITDDLNIAGTGMSASTI